ncbi:sulfotransferase [Winogradskyella vincentii]|uniref:Sulfotransferase n=1 Tax=Winogradskyella vincentii TaxID=2877122 RepID=A0ABS7XXX3_9FLAO|nr:sulfotransferase [Winogradskyella vincentii]MCA0151875.1 sulfotransferase [Winogradskyella vincentii]
MKRTIINILGAGRSGTTMLDLMLGNDHKSFSLGEVHAWFRPFRKHHFYIDCNCGNKNCEFWKKIKDFNEQEFHKKAFDSLGVKFLVDSSKFLPWVIDVNLYYAKSEIETINLIIYKPIIDYVYSVWKRGEEIDVAIKRFKAYYQRFLESGIEAYSINYSELVENTEVVLNRVVTLTNQPKIENRSHFWKKDHHHLFGSGGIRKQVRKGTLVIKKDVKYSNEFNLVKEEIIGKIKLDRQLNYILQELRKIDINTTSRELGQKRLKKPLWYYQLKMKNKIKSILPE